MMPHDMAQPFAAMYELGAYARLSGSAGQLSDDLCTLQMGIFFNAGQVCSATSRLIVHKDIEKQLLAKLKIRAESIRIADPLDAATRMGPIISEQQYNKVLQYIEVRPMAVADTASDCSTLAATLAVGHQMDTYLHRPRRAVHN